MAWPTYSAGFEADTLILMGDGTEKPIKDIKEGDEIKGYDTYFEPEEMPGFDGASVMLNTIVDGTVAGVIEKEVDELMKLNFNDGKTLLVEKDTIAYARPLPCGSIEHDDGSITEGCSSEADNNGIEGSTSKFERHACCNVGWMAVDLASAIAMYGEYDEDDLDTGDSTGYIDSNNYCGLDHGTGVYSNEKKLYGSKENYQKLFALQQIKDYKIDSWETVKGKFKVYNFDRVDDLQLLFANSFVFGTGKVFVEEY
jgi:hypothetical protein|tara:strand:+ start:1524 stop:2288 length:765 start_codon:yes stop_codon:yes gene_type:complete